ncbi:helix-turn-helix transcriptional regulator [Pseudoxanthomonas sp. PXM04]|uniref:helix-turn-helix domain-containing protein n=1 Tax=Pseudoxanthomonas sp. PXM04 TaxID=2769297 RepID=UPI001CE1E053|nr:helix-turn-helix transcriptional regulator [Pseudoxanthomonas sp. PXM04]
MPEIITLRDVEVNRKITSRVRPASQGVKNARMPSFAENLRALRLARKMTQEQLALACGWSGQSRIANYESTSPSAREPKVSEVPVLARALGVSIAELFGEAAPLQGSQSGRLDPAKLAESIAALRQVARNNGWAYDPETHPAETLFAYELSCALPDAPSTADVIDFGAKVAERLRQRVEQDGRQGTGQSTGATNRGRSRGAGA